MFRLSSFSALIVALASGAAAQPPVAMRPPLTLGGAISEALDANPELAALRQEYDAARAAPAEERFLAPPMLETQIWQWPVTTVNPARAEMYMFMAEQELPGRGKRAARVRVGDGNAELSRRQIAVRENAVLRDVTQAFIDVSLARELTDCYEGQSAVLEDVAEAAALRYAGGQGSQQHTVATLVELARLQRDRIQVDERIQAAEARLNTLLGRPPAQPVEPLVPPSGPAPAADAERASFDRHPEIGLAAAAVAREEAELARLRGERKPDYVVGGGYMLMPGDAGAWTARVGITWPSAPWSRGRLNVMLDAQTKRVEAAKARRTAMVAQARQAERQGEVRLAAAQRQVRLFESTVLPQAELAFNLARLGYTAGEGILSDLLESQRMLLATQVEYAEARASVARAVADLESAAGAYE